MSKYIVLLKEDNLKSDVIIETLKENYSNYDWYINRGELVIGIYTAESAEDAIKTASEDYEIVLKSLKAYKLG